LRNAQKRHKKIFKKEEGCTYLPHLVAICQMYVAFIFFSWTPLGKGSSTTPQKNVLEKVHVKNFFTKKLKGEATLFLPFPSFDFLIALLNSGFRSYF
jgi:hypothetical protein